MPFAVEQCKRNDGAPFHMDGTVKKRAAPVAPAPVEQQTSQGSVPRGHHRHHGPHHHQQQQQRPKPYTSAPAPQMQQQMPQQMQQPVQMQPRYQNPNAMMAAAAAAAAAYRQPHGVMGGAAPWHGQQPWPMKPQQQVHQQVQQQVQRQHRGDVPAPYTSQKTAEERGAAHDVTEKSAAEPKIPRPVSDHATAQQRLLQDGAEFIARTWDRILAAHPAFVLHPPPGVPMHHRDPPVTVKQLVVDLLPRSSDFEPSAFLIALHYLHRLANVATSTVTRAAAARNGVPLPAIVDGTDSTRRASKFNSQVFAEHAARESGAVATKPEIVEKSAADEVAVAAADVAAAAAAVDAAAPSDVKAKTDAPSKMTGVLAAAPAGTAFAESEPEPVDDVSAVFRMDPRRQIRLFAALVLLAHKAHGEKTFTCAFMHSALPSAIRNPPPQPTHINVTAQGIAQVERQVAAALGFNFYTYASELQWLVRSFALKTELRMLDKFMSGAATRH